MIPPAVLTECRSRAREAAPKANIKSTAAAIVVVGTWPLLAAPAVYPTPGFVDL